MYVLKTVAILIAGTLLLIFGLFLWWAVWFAWQIRPRRAREPGFKYLFVEDDGYARELDAREREYLCTEFPGGDGGRPYIKLNYEALTPDGRIGGYLRRRQ